MMDLRAYREVVKTAVARERAADKNWGWSVKAVNKGTVRIGWGYLDYIGCDDTLDLTVFNEDDLTVVTATAPNGHREHVFVGDTRWDDAKTIDEAIGIAVHAAATYMHSVY
ncbi:MAG: hypothetical protein IJM76_05805 [Lachnospiraceae bacterium]|nr:hypothetical protein [Lachnospiraceae bacterium]